MSNAYLYLALLYTTIIIVHHNLPRIMLVSLIIWSGFSLDIQLKSRYGSVILNLDEKSTTRSVTVQLVFREFWYPLRQNRH